jgi:tetratricopeptide (TPR) repeat protein
MAAPLRSALSTERPFPGLRPFAPSDHQFFYGRKSQFSALYRLLDLSRFVAVVGSSGSGKSSLVRAGLVPLLQQEVAESEQGRGRHWRWEEMRPGDAPLDQLVDAMTRLSRSMAGDDDPAIADAREERIDYHLRESIYGIGRALDEIGSASDASVVLVVDQFEELFRSAAPVSQRRDVATGMKSRNDAAHFVQLLLEASRSPNHDIRILITMRSDFIGDCAQFQGLPEAVSATQFLVPSLTRDQREQVIRGPLREAHASIESELVERLLNDSADELDQLPVLQHCLLRLWERAGAKPVPSAVLASKRHLTSDHYQAIGGIAHALSQHADEILKSLPGLELVVEQTFRALSDLDKDGRATRRARQFAPLTAETGMPEDKVRAVVNRFRADDCSFLSPLTSDVPDLAPRTRIDVGHEALLRRWELVSGKPDATVAPGEPQQIGWLRAEERDGQVYRSLLAFAESDSSGRPTIQANQFERRWQWWNERPRTPEWAERYGGGHARVVRMLDDSRIAAQAERERREAADARERWFHRMTQVAVVVVTALLIVSLISIYMLSESYKATNAARKEAETNLKAAREATLRAQSASEQAKANLEIALGQTQKLINSAKDNLDRGAISTAAAQELAAVADKAVDELQASAQLAEIKTAKINLLLVVYEIMVAVGKNQEALERALSAQALAQELVAAKAENGPRLLYASLFRIADINIETPPFDINRPRALEQYRSARTIAEDLVKQHPGDGQTAYDLAFITNKIAEALGEAGDYQAANREFQSALTIARAAAAKPNAKTLWQAYPASTMTKIGENLARQPSPDLAGAIKYYDDAMTLQNSLLQQADNDVVKSNLALSHRAKGEALARQRNFAKSNEEYHEAIQIARDLLDKDPLNAGWLLRLAPIYASFGDALARQDEIIQQKCALDSERLIRERLVRRDQGNAMWQSRLADARKKVDAVDTKLAGLRPRAQSLAASCPWRFNQ